MPADHASPDAQAAINAVLAKHPDAIQPRDPNRPEPHWRDIAATDRIPLKHRTKASPPPGGWPTGGTQVQGYHLCTPCGDNIWPGEHIYDNGEATVRCAVCEIKHRTAATAETTDPHAGCQAIEAERDNLRIQLGRAEAETRNMVRDRDEVIAERDQARAATTAAERKHGEALAVITAAWAALNAAGTRGPGSLADHIRQLVAQRDQALDRLDDEAWERVTAERDAARQIADQLRTSLRRARANSERLRHALDITRDGVELIDRALSSVDAQPAQTAAERRDGGDGQPGQGDGATEAHGDAEGDDDAEAERDRCEALADALERAQTIRIDAHGTVWHTAPDGHWHHRIYGTRTLARLDEIFGQTRLALLIDIDEQDAPSPGSGPDRAQGPSRPADWEQKAINAVTDAWTHVEDDAAVTAQRLAEMAVGAIIDAGLAGPGGRCRTCGATYPRTLPPGQDPLCWTCDSGEQTGLPEYSGAATELPDGIRAGRPATLAHDHSTGYPLFAPDAELVVRNAAGPEPWTGAEWNEHVAAAAKGGRSVPERLVACPPRTCTTTCPANPDRVDP